jgi:hypothetical protein
MNREYFQNLKVVRCLNLCFSVLQLLEPGMRRCLGDFGIDDDERPHGRWWRGFGENKKRLLAKSPSSRLLLSTA